MDAKRVFVAASCNRYPHSLDWGEKLVAYAATNAVAIYNVENTVIDHLLVGHSAQVNCVRWISADRTFITTSSDKTSLIWDFDDSPRTFHPKIKLVGHVGPVIIADCAKSDGEFVSATSSSDFSLRFWINDKQVAIKKLKNYAFDVKILNCDKFWSKLSSSSRVVAYSSGDEFVHLLQLTSDNNLVDLIRLSGHEDWVRTIDFVFLQDSNEIVLASGAQDNFIRVWKINLVAKTTQDQVNEKVFDLVHEPSTASEPDLVECQRYAVKLETVLAGHEGWVYGVKLIAPKKQDDNQDPLTAKRCPLQLMSASMDKTIVIWQEPDSEDEVWSEVARVGEVGGNGLGFLGCSFPKSSSDQSQLTSVVGHSFNGAVHFWTKSSSGEWCPGTGLSGHFEPVVEVSWSKSGSYLMSSSADETTRLFANWTRNDVTHNRIRKSWHEIARPQIHGYAINCLTSMDDLSFASGADEKVLRVFRATKSFAKTFTNLTGLKLIQSSSDDLPEGAMVPALGLSNRAVFSSTNQVLDDKGDQNGVIESVLTNPETELNDGSISKGLVLNYPPTEEDLLQNTLFPEVQKLYGHGYELFAIDSNSSGDLIVSSCKASKFEHAKLIVWSVNHNYEQIQQLEGHQLTVTSIKFSPDDNYLVSVSRDRTWCLWKLDPVSGGDRKSFSKIAFSDKTNSVHSRIIWDVSWSSDSKLFVTGSRDTKVAIWQLTDEEDKTKSTNCVKSITESVFSLDDPVTTVDIRKSSTPTGLSDLVLAAGLENGKIVILKWLSTELNWAQLIVIEAHHLSLRKVRWQPSDVNCNQQLRSPLLASCADDRIIQIHEICNS